MTNTWFDAGGCDWSPVLSLSDLSSREVKKVELMTLRLAASSILRRVGSGVLGHGRRACDEYAPAGMIIRGCIFPTSPNRPY